MIHKGIEGVAEERKRYRQYHVTVLDYESKYTGEEAIKRARDLMSKNEEYKLAHNNCEHFVTEVRTGEKQSKQIQAVVKGAAGGGAGGAVTLGAGGAGAGALIGAGIGSVVPGPGTFVVAVGGAIIGGIAGVVSGGAGGAAGGAALGTRLANT